MNQINFPNKQTNEMIIYTIKHKVNIHPIIKLYQMSYLSNTTNLTKQKFQKILFWEVFIVAILH